MGLEPSDYPLPCSIVSTEAKLASTFDSALGFGLHFMKTAEVTSDKNFFFIFLIFQVSTTRLMTPTLSSFLSDVSWLNFFLHYVMPPSIEILLEFYQNCVITGRWLSGTLAGTWRIAGCAGQNNCNHSNH